MSDPSSSPSSASASPTDAASSQTSSTEVPSADSIAKTQAAIHSLNPILTSIPRYLSSSPDPFALLHDPDISSQISDLLRHPDSGTVDNNVCRWLYDTFQTSDPALQLVVLRFLPIIAGVYLSRVPLRKTLSGFEAVLLAIYSHETTSRNGQSITVNIPDLSHPSIYHEAKPTAKNNATEFNVAIISPTLDPHRTVRSTQRAKIVGVALELYYSKISQMPVRSKIDFCEHCEIWAGQDGSMYRDDEVKQGDEDGEKETKAGFKEGRIPLPWELLQPVLRILGHCLLGPHRDMALFDASHAAIRSLYARSIHDIDPRAILTTGSLLRLGKIALDPKFNIDHTEVKMTNVISL
ncbi:hypothetical protein SLEP1_g7249 [Rubroshorea leprosula]|uniref:Hyccin n=1 Tax=Rubroshorea leprosula TaxID=152421 RepID=A0AAV5I7J9_9ROSI|nr:hypothetical protein SLEP1_g7249 [Rubroshorea leprosula]